MAAAEKAGRLLTLSGLFPIYKPKGPTSAQRLHELKKRLLGEAGLKEFGRKRKPTLKIGHGGTLDSSASGVLVIGIGEGTKMLGTMLGGSKKYTAVGELGKGTDTLDATGTVTEEKPYDHVTREELEKVLKTFTGDIMQVPPIFSALKKDGKRLSCLVREGVEVEEKPARPVTVYQLTVTDFQPPLFTLDIECGGGFYVRSLVRDIGKALSSCASVKDLIRTQQGPFTLEDHALPEDGWSIARVAQCLQEYSPLLPQGPGAKRLKTEESPAGGRLRTEESPAGGRLETEESPAGGRLRTEESPAGERLKPEESPAGGRLRTEESPAGERLKTEESPAAGE